MFRHVDKFTQYYRDYDGSDYYQDPQEIIRAKKEK